MLNEQFLFDLLAVQSESGDCMDMEFFITDYLYSLGFDYTKDKEGNIYCIQAKNLPFVVAHMDTVHRIQKGTLIPVNVLGNITGINSLSMEQSGIGGDDKCGIFAALTLFSEGLCNVAFFVDEEIGCVGSYKADVKMFKGTPYILQADRRGNNDFVTNISGDISSKEFQKAVRPYLKGRGYKHCVGMMTDVMALCDIGVGVSMANISAGYYNPHMDEEYINLADLENCIGLMRDILVNVKTRFPHKRTFTRSTGYYSGKWQDEWKDDLWYKNAKGKWVQREPVAAKLAPPKIGYTLNFTETTDPAEMVWDEDGQWIGDKNELIDTGL